MKDLDTRLAAHYARLSPPADFDARLAARLASEGERLARLDRAAALRRALAEHEGARAAAARAWRGTVWRTVGFGLGAVLLVALSLPAWRSFGELLAAGTAASQEPRGLAALMLLALAILGAVLPARWRAAAWSALAR